MRETVWVVRLGGRLYIEGRYGIYPSTTANVKAAKFFPTFEAAEKAARKSGGEVIPLILTDEF